MTAPIAATKSAGAAAPDAPLFDPKAFRLTDEQAGIMSRARHLGQTVFAGRASAYDREARFPVENYRDLHRAGLLGIAIPKALGGLGGVALGAQLIGTALGIVIALVASYIVYGALKAIVGLRLEAEEEFNGSDLSIHRITATPEREATW